jgi:myo-inositol-1-phosphate synthase
MYLNIHYNTFIGTTNYITVVARISDSPSAAVLVADLIRLVPIAKEKEDYIPEAANAFFFKSPSIIYESRIEAFNKLVEWLGVT